MSDTNSNFEMTGTLLGQELRKRNSSGKNRHYSAEMEPDMTVFHVARLHGVFSPDCCLSGTNNIRKEISLLLLPEKMSFQPQNWMPL